MIATDKAINFSAGPAALPPQVLEEASEAVLSYKNSGTSILSVPHRGPHFSEILEESKALAKELCGLGDDYEVLWLQGGGRMQFTMIPANYLGAEKKAGYIDSGNWAADAAKYAKYYGEVNVLSSSKNQNYRELPPWPSHIPNDLAYLHITTNNTIYGTQLSSIPSVNVPLVADMSSDFLSKRTDYSHCDLIYAVAQKNIGPAGATLVIVKKDFLNSTKRELPPMLSYAAHAAKNSVLNTPPVFSIYVSLLTLRWVKEKGINNIEEENNRKAALLYGEVERNPLFSGVAEAASRSKMNICFRGRDENTEQLFLKFAEENGIINIKGHRSKGGFRASLYNAITLADVKYLIAVMQEFELNYNK